jgi:hypothetical protein
VEEQDGDEAGKWREGGVLIKAFDDQGRKGFDGLSVGGNIACHRALASCGVWEEGRARERTGGRVRGLSEN